MGRCTRSMSEAGAALLMAALLGSGARAASTTQVIYSFAGDEDGEYTDTELAIDGAGNLYGTSVQGGDFSSGTVFQLAPSGSSWVHTVLYSFEGEADGGEPYKGVTLDAEGNLYGTAGVGGLYVGPCIDTGCGVVYKLTNSGGTWTQTVIHSFTGGHDGFGPGAGVTVDRHGNILGMTPTGGAYGFGIVYQLHPNGDGTYTERVIHTFTGGADGLGGSPGRLAVDAAGNVFGLSTAGGANGNGDVFELSPTQTGEWNVTVLYAFLGEPGSGFPYGALVADAQGNLYGTTYYAGANDLGTVYRLSRRNGVWRETGIYSFQGGRDGAGPLSTLVAAADGNLYGTTSEGGAGCNCGTIFKLTLTDSGVTYGVAHRFKGPPDGAYVYNGMVADSTGTNLYGATVHGGVSGEGAIYRFTP
ncbi:MAG: choice-of-anchor tandem repeat GloVer-containing protein [Bryobacteraceae bacterium]